MNNTKVARLILHFVDRQSTQTYSKDCKVVANGDLLISKFGGSAYILLFYAKFKYSGGFVYVLKSRAVYNEVLFFHVQMFMNRNGDLETDGSVPVIQEYTLKHDNAGFTFDNGPYFVMERYMAGCLLVLQLS